MSKRRQPLTAREKAMLRTMSEARIVNQDVSGNEMHGEDGGMRKACEVPMPIAVITAWLNRFDAATAYLAANGTTVAGRRDAIEERDKCRAFMPDLLRDALVQCKTLIAALHEVAHHADDECGFMVNVREALAKAEGRE